MQPTDIVTQLTPLLQNGIVAIAFFLAWNNERTERQAVTARLIDLASGALKENTTALIALRDAVDRMTFVSIKPPAVMHISDANTENK